MRRIQASPAPQEVPIDLSPSSTWFIGGDELRLHVSGRALSPRNPLWGSFPALYRASRRVHCTLHSGADTPQLLELPIVPTPEGTFVRDP
jgi:predicted acyl esterase